MREFAESYPDANYAAAAAQIPWGHNMLLLDKIEDRVQRLWYVQQAIDGGWSRSVLESWIESDLYGRKGKVILIELKNTLNINSYVTTILVSFMIISSCSRSSSSNPIGTMIDNTQSTIPATLENFDDLFVGDPVQIEKKLTALLPQAIHHKSIYMQILSQIALAQAMQKNFDAANATLDTAEKFLTAEDHVARTRILLERGRTLMQKGELKAARPFFKQSFDVAKAHDLDYHTCNAAHMIAIAAEGANEKIKWNELAIQLCERSTIPRARMWLGSLYNNLGHAYIEVKQYEQALSALERAKHFREQEGNLPNIRVAKWAVSKALRLLGRTDEALNILLPLLKDYDSMRKRNALDIPAAMLPSIRGLVYEELAEIYKIKAQGFAKLAFDDLSQDEWFKKLEPQRLEQLGEQAQR